MHGTYADGLCHDGEGERRVRALRLHSGVMALKAKLATKLDDGVTAYAAAGKALTSADEADDLISRAAASYQLSCALLKLDGVENAERNAVESADLVRGEGPAELTWRGSLSLIAAIIAARRADAVEAGARLEYAESLARRLGRDGNIGFSAFGPTNVTIHRMSAAVALDDPDAVLALGERFDVTAMPEGCTGGRASTTWTARGRTVSGSGTPRRSSACSKPNGSHPSCWAPAVPLARWWRT